jgi:cytochrome oxidase Cu insertion factor (SCO1/SenC/PrrC family)
MLERPLLAAAFSLALTLGLATAAAADDAATSEAKPVAVGQEAPTLALPGDDGETYRLADLEGKQPAVVIFFRGTW